MELLGFPLFRVLPSSSSSSCLGPAQAQSKFSLQRWGPTALLGVMATLQGTGLEFGRSKSGADLREACCALRFFIFRVCVLGLGSGRAGRGACCVWRVSRPPPTPLPVQSNCVHLHT